MWDWCFAQRLAPVQLQHEQVLFDGRPWQPDPADEDRHFWFPATWAELAAGASAGVLEIGAHGATHTPWSWLSAADRRRELGEVRERLEGEFGAEVRACSYPHGMMDEAARAGAAEYYSWAFTSLPAAVHGGASAHALPRFNVPGERPLWMRGVVQWPLAGRVVRKGASFLGLN